MSLSLCSKLLNLIVKRDILILNPSTCILLNTYLNKIFLRSSFPEEYEKDYVKKLKDRVVKQERKKKEILKDLERTLEFPRMEDSVLNE